MSTTVRPSAPKPRAGASAAQRAFTFDKDSLDSTGRGWELSGKTAGGKPFTLLFSGTSQPLELRRGDGPFKRLTAEEVVDLDKAFAAAWKDPSKASWPIDGSGGMIDKLKTDLAFALMDALKPKLQAIEGFVQQSMSSDDNRLSVMLEPAAFHSAKVKAAVKSAVRSEDPSVKVEFLEGVRFKAGGVEFVRLWENLTPSQQEAYRNGTIGSRAVFHGPGGIQIG